MLLPKSPLGMVFQPRVNKKLFIFLKGHTGMRMICVRVPQINVVLREEFSKITISSYELFGDPGIRLSHVKRVYISMATHGEIASKSVVFFARDVSKYCN